MATATLARKPATPTKRRMAVPEELWMLWRVEKPKPDQQNAGWALPCDDPPGCENFLVCLSFGDAQAAAKYQLDNYGIECVPVRVK